VRVTANTLGGSLRPDGPSIGLVICRVAGKVLAEVRRNRDGPYLRFKRRVRSFEPIPTRGSWKTWKPGQAFRATYWHRVQVHTDLQGRAATETLDCPDCSKHDVDLLELEREVRDGLRVGDPLPVKYMV